MAKPRKENLSKAKSIMAAMLGMKPKPHEDMKLKKTETKKTTRRKTHRK